MVFPIVSTPIRKNDKSTKSARANIPTRPTSFLSAAFFGLICLSACSTQEDASAQLNRKTGFESNNQSNNQPNNQSNESLKNEGGSASAGQAIFERANCAMCHPGGNNTMAPGHPVKGPEFARKYAEDSLLESIIRKGFPEVGMPAFSKEQIDDKEMKELIAYVRTLTAPIKLPHQTSPRTTNSPAVKSTK